MAKESELKGKTSQEEAILNKIKEFEEWAGKYEHGDAVCITDELCANHTAVLGFVETMRLAFQAMLDHGDLKPDFCALSSFCEWIGKKFTDMLEPGNEIHSFFEDVQNIRKAKIKNVA